MKNLIIFLLFFSFDISAQDFLWQKSIYGMGGGPGDGASEGIAMEIDTLGNIYALGNFSNTVDFDPSLGYAGITSYGERDVFLAKYDSSGNFIWVKRIGGAADEEGHDLTFDHSGNILIMGHFESYIDADPSAAVYSLTSIGCVDYFSVKLDPAGNFIWAKKFGGPTNNSSFIPNKVVCDSLNSVYLAGVFTGTIDFDPGPAVNNYTTLSVNSMAPFVVKLDANGDFQWVRVAKTIGATSQNRALSIGINKQQGVYLFWKISAPTTFYDGINTYTLGLPNQLRDYLLRLNTSGNIIWEKQFEGGYDNADLKFDDKENMLFTGTFSGWIDCDPGPGALTLTTSAFYGSSFVIKLDSAASLMWGKKMQAVDLMKGFSVYNDKRGFVYTVGTFSVVSDLDPGPATYTLGSIDHHCAYLQVLDSSGNFAAARFTKPVQQIPYTDYIYNNSVVVNKRGAAYMLGTYFNPTNFDPAVSNYTVDLNAPTNQGNAFLVKYGPTPNITSTVVTKLNKEIGEVFPSIYPNPASTTLFINQRKDACSARLYNVEGKEVVSEQLVKGENEIDISPLPKGIYILKVEAKDQVLTKKIVKVE